VSGVIGLESDRNVDGLDRETDRELRERYYLSLAAGGAATIDSIRAAVLKVPGVRTARVFQNPTMEFDDEGRPPKSVEVVVLGGADGDVAQAIHDTIAAGIESSATWRCG
jgi:Baseplate J-like protein.